MRTNYVLVDFESVQPEGLEALAPDHFKLLIFVGAGQTKVPFGVADAVQKLGSRAEYVKISGNGPNALDFHIALYIGRLSSQEPDAFFHVVSKDKGFDPLIHHLKEIGVFSGRSERLADIPAIKVLTKLSPEERCAAFVARLAQSPAARPRSIKTLRSAVVNFFQKQLSDDDVEAVMAQLQVRQLVIEGPDKKLTYTVDAGG